MAQGFHEVLNERGILHSVHLVEGEVHVGENAEEDVGLTALMAALESSG